MILTYILFFAVKSLLLAIPIAAWVWLARKVLNRSRSANTRRTIIHHITIIVCVSPAVWILLGLMSFGLTCASIQPLKVFHIPRPQQSILLRITTDVTIGRSNRMPLSEIFEQIPLPYVETDIWRPSTHVPAPSDKKYRRDSRLGSEDILLTKEPLSEYAVSIEVKPSGFGTGFLLAYRVRNISTGSIAAEKLEVLFGRGLIGHYLALPKLGIERELLACGYGDKQVRRWRQGHGPGTRDHASYFPVDLELFRVAAGLSGVR